MLKINDANEFRRTALGLCLIAGPLVTLIGGLIAPWEESDTKAAWLRVLAENPLRAQAGAVCLYFGYLLIAVSIFGILNLLRHRAVVLGHVAGVFAIWGWITLPGLLVVDFYDLALAQSLDLEQAVAISERPQDYALAPLIGLSVPLGILALVLLVVALWRTGFAPVWVPVLFFGGTAVSFFGPPSQIFFSIGPATWLITLGYVGLKVLRLSDKEWEYGVTPEYEPPRVV
jgi:hypothetical protein